MSLKYSVETKTKTWTSGHPNNKLIDSSKRSVARWFKKNKWIVQKEEQEEIAVRSGLISAAMATNRHCIAGYAQMLDRIEQDTH